MIHERGYWLSTAEIKTHVFDKKLSDAIIELFPIKKVADIGCGDGSYVENFLEHGIGCMGFDGSPLTLAITKRNCYIKDFSERTDIGLYDLVLSLEVGEHIPRKYEQNFIANISYTASKYICLSWAVEGQAGTGHFNCRNNDYIIKEFERRCWKHNMESSQFLRDNSTLPWFKNTILVFEK